MDESERQRIKNEDTASVHEAKTAACTRLCLVPRKDGREEQKPECQTDNKTV